VSLRDELRAILEKIFREIERVASEFLDDLERPTGGTVSLTFKQPTKDQ
jgi:hypothetical protein